MSDDPLDRSFVVTNNTNIINISIISQQVNDVSFEIPLKRYSGTLLATEITNMFRNNDNTINLSTNFIHVSETPTSDPLPTFYIESGAEPYSQKTYIFNYEKTTARSLLGMQTQYPSLILNRPQSSPNRFTTVSDEITRMFFGEGKANEGVENVADLLVLAFEQDRLLAVTTEEEILLNILNGLSEQNLNAFNFGFRASFLSEDFSFSRGVRYGFISINDYKTNSKSEIQVVYNDSVLNDSVLDDPVLDDHIIARMNLIQITANTLSMRDSGMSKLLNRTRRYKVPVDIQKFTIKLYDDYGRIIDMNNMDWSFTLEFEKKREKLTINKSS